jgi:hypothetical protein
VAHHRSSGCWIEPVTLGQLQVIIDNLPQRYGLMVGRVLLSAKLSHCGLGLSWKAADQCSQLIGGRGLPMDYDELARWTRVGFERRTAARRGERGT